MSPIFVGSDSSNSRIRSNRIGFAASTTDPGSAAEGDGYYNSTDDQLKVYDGSAWNAIQGSGTFEAVASGAIPNGATVVINTDGTVGIVTLVPSNTPTFGSAVVFESAQSDYVSAVYDSTNNKVVVAYTDAGNSNHGTAIVGTVSGTSISFGTPVVFESNASYLISATFDSTNGKVVICYRHGSTYYGTAIVGTVSGTSISFGSAAVFESANTNSISATFDSSNNKVVIAYRDAGNSSYGTAIVGTVSGTSISFGSAVVFESANSAYISAVFDSSNNKVVIAYKDTGNSSYGTAIVGTVSGTSISFGTPVVFHSSSFDHVAATFDSKNGRVVIAYQDGGNSSYGTAIVGAVSGTSISFGSAVVFESADTIYSAATFDSTNNKVVIGYRDRGNSEYGTAIVATTSGTNLTTENFIGFSDAAYSNGQTGRVQIVSSVDDAQTGLTTGAKHYVQNDGSLSTSAGNPSVFAGTAISATKIQVKM